MKMLFRKALQILILLCMLAYVDSAHAQLLKKIIANVKQPKNNSNENTSAHTDSSAFNKVLGGFAKAVQDNPNDTSAADVAMKGLNNMIGGGGVSAADSANAIKIYSTASGGSGTYYEYIVETTTKRAGASKSTSKMYLTNTGEGRSEMNIAAMMGAKNGSALVVIGRENQPHYSVILDDENKAYSLNVIDTSLINDIHEKYAVTRLGNEVVNGFNCAHAKVVSTAGSGLFKSSNTEEIWTSTDVPGYAIFKKATLQKNITPGMMKALNDAGCGGFFVKMSSGGKEYSMTMQLNKVEKQSFPSSLFKIPSNYTESKDNLMFGNMMKGAQKQ